MTDQPRVQQVSITKVVGPGELSADLRAVDKVLGQTMEKLLRLGTAVDLHQELVGDPTSDELGARAARLVASMLAQAGRYLTGGFQEINEVLIEARQRGWLDD